VKSHVPILLSWIFFLSGQAIYVLSKAWRVVISPKNPAVATYGAYFRRNWVPLLARVFGATCLFILAQAPSGFTASFAPDFFSDVKSCGLSGLCGLGTDALLEKFVDRVPFFKNFVPEADGVGPNSA
jgi:hypothetical protein